MFFHNFTVSLRYDMVFEAGFDSIYYWLPIVGLITGFLGPLVGGGGSFIFLPVLIVILDIPITAAVPTALAASIPVCLAGSFANYRNKIIDKKMVLTFSLAGVMGALLGAELTGLMKPHQLQVTFGVYSILIGIYIFLIEYRSRRSSADSNEIKEMTQLNKFSKGSFFGILAGTISGTFGTAGTAPIIAGLMAVRIPLKVVAGTALAVSVINTTTALGMHFLVGEINMTLVSLLTAGSVIGALTGAWVLKNIRIRRSEGPVKIAFALVMFFSGILIILY